jgi:hypothetical protein
MFYWFWAYECKNADFSGSNADFYGVTTACREKEGVLRKA